MTTILLAVACMACAATTDEPPDDDEAARSYFDRLYDDRAAIKSGYVEYTLTHNKVPKHEDLDGWVHRCRVWFDGDRIRLDSAESRPKDPSATRKIRMARADGITRLIQDDVPDMAVHEYTQKYLEGHKSRLILRQLATDPRLFGLVPGSFSSAQRSSLVELRRQPGGATIRGSRVDLAGGPAARIDLDYGPARRTTIVVKGSSLLPSTITTRYAPQARKGGSKTTIRDIREEIECAVERMPNSLGVVLEYPRRIDIRRIEDGKEVLSQTIEITKADLNVPIDASTYSWKALSPRRGVNLIPNDDYKPTIVWDGGQFREADPGLAAKAAPVQSRPASRPRAAGPSRLASYVLLGGSALLGTLVVAAKFVAHRRSLSVPQGSA